MNSKHETTSTVSFKYRYMNFTAHLKHINDPAYTPRTEIDKIVHDDSGKELDAMDDEDIFDYFFDHHFPIDYFDRHFPNLPK